MTTTRHTALPFGGPLTSAAMEAPLAQLDTAIVDVEADVTTILAQQGAGGWYSILDAEAASGQKVVPVATPPSADAVNASVYIGAAGAGESFEIASVQAGVSITSKTNLGATYAAGTPISATPAEVADARDGYATLGERVRGGVFDVRAFGAKGDGTTDDTTAVQAAFTAAAPSAGEVYLPPGTYLVGTINYKGQSIRGAGANITILLGKAGQDVLHVDPTVAVYAVSGMHWRDFTIRVNDSVDAHASFPERGGVGNAGFASDYPDGSASQPLAMLGASIKNVMMDSLSAVVGGQNVSAGFYCQTGTFTRAWIADLTFYRLAYGWWNDYPTSNLATTEIACDNLRLDKPYFNGCGHAWRLVNNGGCSVTQVTLHVCPVGIELVGIATGPYGRASLAFVSFDGLTIENSLTSLTFTGTVQHISWRNIWIGSTVGSDAPDLGCHYSRFDGATFLTPATNPVLHVTGDRNVLTGVSIWGVGTAAFQWDQIDDQGIGNTIEVVAFATAAAARLRLPVSATRDNRVLHSRDALPGLMGHVDPMPVGLGDLLLNPASIVPIGTTADWSLIADATADFGLALRTTTDWGADIGVNGDGGFLVGSSLPKAHARVYIKSKFATGGTRLYVVYRPGYVNAGSATLTFTTSYTVQSFDIDLTGATVGEQLLLATGGIGGGGAGPEDIAWIIIRPWFHDLLSDGHLEVGQVSGGIILKSPDGTRYIAKIANGGTWTIAAA